MVGGQIELCQHVEVGEQNMSLWQEFYPSSTQKNDQNIEIKQLCFSHARLIGSYSRQPAWKYLSLKYKSSKTYSIFVLKSQFYTMIDLGTLIQSF